MVGFPPGGGSDLIARILQPALGDILGGSVIVENRPGASGIVATQELIRSAPDGYTLLLLPSAHASNAAVMRELPYDPVTDTTPIILVGHTLFVLAVHPSVPAQSMQDLIALAKTQPVPFGTSGPGGFQHQAGELLRVRTGGDFVHVPFRGGGQALQALVAGHVKMQFVNLSTILPFVRENQLRPLAVAWHERVPDLPGVPTTVEAGWAELTFAEWYGIFGPRNMPVALRDRLISAVERTLRREDVVARLREGRVPIAGSPSGDAFDAFVRSEVARFREIVRVTGITPQ
jgi:tripartite-type tricarboxylate transporter receptor subunit TctC